MSMTATILEIMRSSLNDGPGVRTTLLLKGCPLRCTWCHSPESQVRRPQLSYSPERCMGCRICAGACPAAVHTFGEDGDDGHEVDRSRCDVVGACAAACPNEALRVVGREMSVDEIMAIVLRDRAFYARSGGGVTISGGEPMAQFEATLLILQRCKRAGIHTCLDTCGHAPRRHFQAVLPWVDLFLFDYKETDPQRHGEVTGAGNELILANLDHLYRQGARIRLRCPIVPTLNDRDDHFAGIVALESRYPDLDGTDLMPYHAMGREKGRWVGMDVVPLGVPTVNDRTRRLWEATLAEKRHRQRCASRLAPA
jgi:pyruvate formate lyase activating enzyme